MTHDRKAENHEAPTVCLAIWWPPEEAEGQEVLFINDEPVCGSLMEGVKYRAVSIDVPREALSAWNTRDEGVGVEEDVRRRLLSVCDTLESAGGQAFPIDFHNLAADIRSALQQGTSHG